MSRNGKRNYYVGKIGEQANQNQQIQEVRRYDKDGNLIDTIEKPGNYEDRKKTKWKWRRR